MTKKIQGFTAVLCVVLFCGITLGQEPGYVIDKKIHPNLYEAQRRVVEAITYITTAEKDNRYDMKGHAEKARKLLLQVNDELRAAAEAANAAMQKK